MEQIEDDHRNDHVLEIKQIDQELGGQLIDQELVEQIDQELEELSSIPSSECCIFKVNEALRNSNVKAYEPEVVAIGPYHHAKYEKNAHLRLMEKHKLWYLKQYLKRRKATSAASYVVAMRELEGKARNCYAEPINLSTNEFVAMMLLDGCFIIELLVRNEMDDTYDDPVFQLNHLWEGLPRDLLLFENQLPLFILVRLYYLLSEENPDLIPDTTILRMVHTFFKHKVNLYVETFDDVYYEMEDHKHLLSLVHCYSCYQFKLLKPAPPVYENGGDYQLRTKISNIKPATELQEAGVKFIKVDKELLAAAVRTSTILLPAAAAVDSDTVLDTQLIGAAAAAVDSDTALDTQLIGAAGDTELSGAAAGVDTELQVTSAGVTFKKVDTRLSREEAAGVKATLEVERRRSLFDIRFQNDSEIMEIPTLVVEDGTESLFRNFIAYEQYLPANKIRYFTNYTSFLDCLVNYSKDVELFRGLGIFDSRMGDDEVISLMLNKLGDGVILGEDFYYCYKKVMDEVNMHCSRPRNRWLAILRRDYFNTPWAIFTPIAGVVTAMLFLLTITQTVFSILSVV